MISTNQFKNGNHIEVDGTIFRVQEFQHVKPVSYTHLTLPTNREV